MKVPKTASDRRAAYALFRRALKSGFVNLGRGKRAGPKGCFDVVTTMNQTEEVIIGAWVSCEVYISADECKAANGVSAEFQCKRCEGNGSTFGVPKGEGLCRSCFDVVRANGK